jgi:hypothetical protein
METHSHSHTDNQHRKKWSHYVWEFLMLFLAVFAGFVAENIRENLTERKREKQYIESLVVDLAKDTSMIRGMMKANFKIAAGQDSLIDILDNFKDTGTVSRKCYRYYFLYTTRFLEVEFNERTISQLLNAGNMRMIERKGISDSIMDYNLVVNYVKEQAKAYEDYFKKTLDLSGSIFDFGYARTDLHEDFTITPHIAMAKTDLRLLTTDRSVLKKYTVQLALSKAILQGYIMSLQQAKEKAITLITLLNKKYKLPVKE